MTSQTIHMLVYKTRLQINYGQYKNYQYKMLNNLTTCSNNDYPMNNNFWHLFTQLISQLARMYKKSNIAMTEWEQHFQKLQHGLTFDENSPGVIENSENENCNKKITQNDVDPSQNKSHDKHKTHSLDEYIEKMKKLRATQKHLNIDKKKRCTFNPKYKNFPMKHLIQKHKTKIIAKKCACATKNIFGIWMKKISLITDRKKNVTIAKDIMNYV